jgi:hypothetical protein
MIRPIMVLRTEVARILVNKDFEDLAAKGGVVLWNLEGRWGLITAPIVANAFTAWRDHAKLTALSPSTPPREFYLGWNQAMAILPSVVTALLEPGVAVPLR